MKKVIFLGALLKSFKIYLIYWLIGSFPISNICYGESLRKPLDFNDKGKEERYVSLLSMSDRRDEISLAVLLHDHGGPFDIAMNLYQVAKVGQYLEDERFQSVKHYWPDRYYLTNKDYITNLIDRIRNCLDKWRDLYYKIYDINQKDVFLPELDQIENEANAMFLNLEKALSEYVDFFEDSLDENSENYIPKEYKIRQLIEKSLPLARRVKMNCYVTRVFLMKDISKEMPEIPLSVWLLNRDWRTKVLGGTAEFFKTPVGKEVEKGLFIKANPDLLHVVIERILSNGFHALRKRKDEGLKTKGIVRLEAGLTKDKRFVEIRIYSDGSISKDKLKKDKKKHLAGLFVLDPARADMGHGIGMPFTANAVIKMGGNITVRNIRKGGKKEVVFIVRFPALDSENIIIQLDRLASGILDYRDTKIKPIILRFELVETMDALGEIINKPLAQTTGNIDAVLFGLSSERGERLKSRLRKALSGLEEYIGLIKVLREPDVNYAEIRNFLYEYIPKDTDSYIDAFKKELQDSNRSQVFKDGMSKYYAYLETVKDRLEKILMNLEPEEKILYRELKTTSDSRKNL